MAMFSFIVCHNLSVLSCETVAKYIFLGFSMLGCLMSSSVDYNMPDLSADFAFVTNCLHQQLLCDLEDPLHVHKKRFCFEHYLQH
jgi:hypothetical protein